MVDPDNQGFACLGSLPSHWPSVFLCPFWRSGIRFCGFGAGWWVHGAAQAARVTVVNQHGHTSSFHHTERPAVIDRAGSWRQCSGPGKPGWAHPSQPGLPLGRSRLLPWRCFIRGCLPPCSRWPPWVQPIRREHSPQAPANPQPVFAGTAKPLGEKQ